MAQSTHRPFASGGIHWLGFLSVILIAAMLLVAAPQPAAAADPNPAPVQLFYVTLPETDGLAALDAINTAASTPVYTYFSIAVGVSGSYVYYDQWENGYAGDIANPTSAEIYNSATNPAGVQIWGNGKATDGCAPNIAGVAFTCTDAADVLNAGNVIIPYNAVPVPRAVVAQSNVLDNFNSRSYSNNNGNTNWASNWVETGDDGSATAGQIQVATSTTPTQLRFTATDANDSIDRGVNLSTGGSCATLSFTLGQNQVDSSGDNFAVQISSDGTTYTTLATYTSSADADAKSIGISGYASANTRVRFLSVNALETGEYWSVDDVQVSWNCSLPILFDGKDKVGASSSIAMARATWATGSGTLNAFAHEMYATAEWGMTYEAPVGTNTANAGQMFEYSALSIMASQNNTTVQIDADANGTFETTVTLQEGGTTLVPNILQGARVQSDKPVQVVLVTGDISSSYASRDMNLLPVSAYGSSYWSPVGENTNAAYPTRLFLYNLSTNGSIYITCERYGVANTTLGPVAARGVVTVDLITGQGAHCFASTSGGVATSNPISAIGTIDTTNTAYDWSFTLYPDAYLTTDALVGLGLGKDPTNTTSTENGSPLWVTAACASGGTYVYVDWNNDGTADPVDTNGDDVAETGSQNGILVTRLQSVRLFEPGADTEPYDQSGARVWSRTTSGVGYGGDPGCNLALAWGEDPANATGGAPGLDVGTSIPPLRPIEGTKSAAIVTDTAPIGVLNPGDTVYYNITVHNAGTVQVDNVYVYDTVPNNTTYVASSTEWNTTGVAPWTAIADVGGTLPLAQTGGVLLGNLGADQTFYVRFKVTLLAGNYEDITNCDTAYTSAGSFSKCVTTPVATRDWGDLPDSYGTSASQNGPRHSSSGLMLGSLWDVEVQGQSSLGADGDDLATSDDEDGVTRNLSQLWLPGATVHLNVTVTGGTGVLGGWFDWNNDGDVADSGEFISFGTLSAGTNSVAVTIPSAYSAGASVYARFRLAASSNFPGGSLDAGDYLGFAVGGEVEDYLWNLQSPELNVVKSSTITAIDHAGQVVPYTFVVTNVGNQILTGVTVSDPNCTSAISGPTGDTNSDGKLDLTETWTYTCNHTVTQAEIDAGGNLSNTVTADSTESGPDTDTKNIPITQTPALNVAKSSTTTAITTAGQTVPYTFVVTNVGNQILTGVTVSDPNCTSAISGPTGDTNSDGKLDLTETWTYTCNHTVTQAEIDAGGNLSNTVTADSTESAPDTDTHAIPITQSPGISIVKTTNGADGLNIPVGDAVTWTYVVKNTGNVALTNVTVTDDKLVDIDCDGGTNTTTDHIIASLGVNAEVTCTATGVAVAGLYENTGTATGTPPVSNNVTANDPSSYFGLVPEITVTKTGAPTLVPETGGDVVFTYVVQNTGNVPVTIASLSDDKFGTLTGDDDCKVGTVLAGGASCTFFATFAVPAGDYPGSHVDVFSATATYNTTTVSDDDDETVTYTDVLPDITVTKTGDPLVVPETGGNVTFTYVVKNNSLEAATITALSDDQFGLLAGDDDCKVGTVLSGLASCTFQATFAIPAGATGTTHVDVFTAKAVDDDANEATDNDDETITRTDVKPDISVTKVASPLSLAEPGGEFTFTYVVTNDGTVPVTLNSVTDSVIGTIALPEDVYLLPGESTVAMIGKYTYTDDGVYPNTVTAIAADADGNTDTAAADASVEVTDTKPAITVTKTGDPTTVLETGGSVVFTYVVANTGTVPVTLTSLVDDKFGALAGDADCTIGDAEADPVVPATVLAAGASCSFEATFAIPAGAAGTTHEDVFTATAVDDDANEATDNDDETITRTDVKPAITVTKTGDPTTVLETGGSVVFTYVVANTGTVPVTLTSLVDDKFGALAGDADCTIGDAEADPVVPATVLAAGASCTFQATFAIPAGAAGTTHEDVFTAKAVDDDANEATDNDDETITRTDVKPDISVTKVASPLSLAEPGGEFTFTYVVTNDGTVPVTLNSVTDSVIGTIALPEDVYLLPGESTVAMIGKYTYTDDGVYPNTVTAIAADADGNTDTAAADASVEVTDTKPAITVTKTGDPTTVLETGGSVVFTYVVANTGTVPVTLTSLVDDKFGALAGDADCTIGDAEADPVVPATVLAAGASCSFEATFAIPAGAAGTTHEDVFTATAVDDDANEATDNDDETITRTDVKPDISVTKVASPLSLAEPGGEFTFTYVVTNDGTVPVTLNSVTDSVIGTIAPAGGRLPAAG